MKITLRKANAIQTAINDTLRGINLNSKVQINEFQNAEAELQAAASKFFADANRKDKLLRALYTIRKAVGDANSSVGIDGKLSDVALLDKQIQLYTLYANHDVRDDAKVVEGKLEKIRARPNDSRSSIYGYNDTVETAIFTQADVDGFRATVARDKKAKQKLQDEILELNVRTEIELDSDTVATLTAEQLV